MSAGRSGLIESDIAMHDMIIQTADNWLFSRLAQLVGDRSARVRSLVPAIADSHQILTVIDEPCAILAALRARDRELTYDRLTSHLLAGM